MLPGLSFSAFGGTFHSVFHSVLPSVLIMQKILVLNYPLRPTTILVLNSGALGEVHLEPTYYFAYIIIKY